MPQRAVNLVLVVAGVATVALLMVLGFDLARAASRGPQWKRRLVGAGLVLLMAIGFAPDLGRAAAEESKPAASAAPAASDKGLAEAKGWKRILAAWNEAEEIASGKRGAYPFDEKGQKQILQNLLVAQADVKTLQKAQLVTEPEAGLLIKDLDLLAAGVRAKRPTEAQSVTCYWPAPLRPGHDSLQRLSDRLPLLEKLAASKTLHCEVVEKVLARVEADIQNLGKEESLKEFAKAAEREKAEKTRDAARAAVLRIRDRVWPPAIAGADSEKTLDESKGWKRIGAAWNEAQEIASGKRGDYPFDEAGKKRLLEDLKKAEADAAELQKAKLITQPEAGLLLKDLGTLTDGVLAKQPTEMKMVTCYAPMPFQPGRDSFNRLSNRLPLLEKLAASKTLHREVVEKVLARVEADIQNLGKEESLAALAKTAEREKAEKTRDAARAAVLRIRDRVWPPATAGAASEKTLDESKGWKRIGAAWNEAQEIASGKRGDYPFDEAGKKRLLEDLKKAEADVADLEKTKLITQPEAGLLLKDLGTLTTGVDAKRPTADRNFTCYDVMGIRPGHDSFQRLSDRLPLLEKLAAAVTLHPEVVEKVLASIETDILTLSKEESLKEFAKAEEREKAEKTRDAAKASALRLRRRITAPVMCYYLYLMSIPLRKPESKQEQSVARLKILETPAAAAALRPEVLRQAAANARSPENKT